MSRFNEGDRLECIERSWGALGHMAVVVSSSEADGSFRLKWETKRFDVYPWLNYQYSHIKCFKLLSHDPKEEARLLDRRRRQEHAMRYL